MRRFIGSFLILGLLAGVRTVSADPYEEDILYEDLVELKPVRPDLLVSSFSAPTYTNGGFQVRVTLQNHGIGSSGSFRVLLLDETNGYTQTKTVRGLARRMQATLIFNVSAPENQGPWQMSAIADYGNAVVESNENNNVKRFYQP